MITKSQTTQTNQTKDPTIDESLEIILSAVRMLQLNYSDHVMLDRCVNIIRQFIDSHATKMDTDGLNKLSETLEKIKK